MATHEYPSRTEADDDLGHFLGTLQFSDRHDYFKDPNARQGAHEQSATQVARDSRIRALDKIIKELERAERIREMIANESSESHLVTCLRKSCDAWKGSEEYKLGIGKPDQKGGLVNEWSKRDKFDTSPSLDSLRTLRHSLEGNSQSQSSSDRGLNPTPQGHSRELPKRIQRQRSSSRVLQTRKSLNTLPKTNEAKEIAYDADEDFNSYLIQYIKFDNVVMPWQVESLNTRIAGTFPDQRLPVRQLLGGINVEQPSGRQQRETSDHRNKSYLPASNLLNDTGQIRPMVRYFHFPANNMAWVERAISLYYKDDRASISQGRNTNSEDTREFKARTLLRSEYWRGQQQGDRGAPIHARHMRPLCETISLTTDDENVSHPKDIVLFMPYLHWETDRKRHTFANFIDTVSTTYKVETTNRKADIRVNNIKNREGLEKPARFNQKATDQSPRPSRPWTGALTSGSAQLPATSIKNLVDNMNILKLRLEIDENRRVKSREPDDKNTENRLGQYLLDSARLYEGIANYRDKKLPDKYLHADPPIHPRRTLDQAYYWSLNTTQGRDRDQVVYRGTRAAVENLHQFDIRNQVWPKHEEQKDAWISPDSHEDNAPCRACQDNIRKISRLIMVDQLWMWVLDEHTILTFFPRRYGANKNDATGVHKSIRTKLDKVSKSRHPEQQMGSVWDLALIIFDECTNTFFDRTKTPDRQPQIIDDFSEAIGNVTIAFDRLWAWTEQWKANNSLKSKSRTTDLHVALLDINPEGKLQREIKDIIEELEIMIHINRIHKTILKSFIHQVIRIMDPNGHMKSRFSGYRTNDEHVERTAPTPKISVGGRTPSGSANKTDYDRFESKGEEVLIKVTSRIEELEELRRSAQSTSDSIKDLLALKQQQASVVQAWQATQQTEETVAQGRSIMMFTVVTIVFAPLSFMTSVFGMNAYEFSPSQNNVKIIDQLKFILPVSAATILLVLFLAFSPYVRAILKALYYRISSILFAMHLWGGHSAYKLWYANNNWRGEVQIDKAHAYAHKKKEAARAEISRKRWENSLQELSAQNEEKSSSEPGDQGGDGSHGNGTAVSGAQAHTSQQEDRGNTSTSNGAAVPTPAAMNVARQSGNGVTEGQDRMGHKFWRHWFRGPKGQEQSSSV
ncbi:ankyrin repeat protein [Apiospora saccharicola]|uniref:Ankyrin repeat protein n=1 Tax=Apiospora saccharicola TaxID=335842 RepID=A0ABR1THJ8_9PEZI